MVVKRSHIRVKVPGKNPVKAKSTATALPSAAQPAGTITVVLVTVLLVSFTGLSIWEMWDDSVTIDERVYLPAGYAYWTQKDFGLNPEHPPLVKLLAAIPLLAMDLKFSPTESESPPAPNGTRQSEAERQMAFGSRLLYSNNADQIMFWGRLPMIALAGLLGVFIFWWSWKMHNSIGAGLVSLFLFSFEPTFIAHGHYVTTDVPLACFSVMAMLFLNRFLCSAKPGDLALASLGLGLALASKYSAIFLVPCFYFLLLVMWPSRDRIIAYLPSNNPLAARILSVMGSVLIAAVTIQATYLFSWDLSLYWHGLRAVNVNELPQSVLTYIHGDFYPGGVWWYPMYVLLLKVPLATIVVVIIAAVATFKMPDESKQGLIGVLLPAAVFTTATCALANNLGVRYMAPVLAFLFVFAGRAWLLLTKNPVKKALGGILSLWLVVSVLRVSPHHLAYFNEWVGGPKNAPYYLDDSNVDWGQDFKRLMSYLTQHGIAQAVLAYWGPTPKEYYESRYGVRFLPWTYDIAGSPNPPAGVYAISVNHLIGLRRELRWQNRRVDPNMDWLKRFEPVARVGYSIYVYKLP